jgi:hypothetical protein
LDTAIVRSFWLPDTGYNDLGRVFTISTLFLAYTGYPVKGVLGANLQNDRNTVNDVPISNGALPTAIPSGSPARLGPAVYSKSLSIGARAGGLSIEGFNLTRAGNKQFNSDGESPFESPQAKVNPNTGLAFTGNTALAPTLSPGADYFGGARQAQLGIRFVRLKIWAGVY